MPLTPEETELLRRSIENARSPRVAFDASDRILERDTLSPEEADEDLEELIRADQEFAEPRGLPSGPDPEGRVAQFRAEDIPGRVGPEEEGLGADVRALASAGLQAFSPRVTRDEDERVTLRERALRTGRGLLASDPNLSRAARAVGVPGAPTEEEVQTRARDRAEKMAEAALFAGEIGELLGAVDEGDVEKAREALHGGPGVFDKLFPEALQSKRDVPSGLPIESQEEAIVKFLGTAIPATVQELGYSLPVPAIVSETAGPLGPRDRLERSASFAALLDEGVPFVDALRATHGDLSLGSARLEQVLLGTTPAKRGLLAPESLEGRGAWVRPLLQAAYKTELGNSLTQDLPTYTDELGLGDNARKMAMAAGFAGELMVPWEMPVGKAAKGVQLARSLKDLPEEARNIRGFLALLQERPADIARPYRMLVEDAMAEGDTPSDILAKLPTDMRGMVREMMLVDGLDLDMLDDDVLTTLQRQVEPPELELQAPRDFLARDGDDLTLPRTRERDVRDLPREGMLAEEAANLQFEPDDLRLRPPRQFETDDDVFLAAPIGIEPEIGPTIPSLPRALAGAKPKFQHLALDFESDVEKALFITSQKKKSLRDSAYRAWLREDVGLSEADIDRLGQRVRSALRQMAKKAPKDAGFLRIPKVALRQPAKVRATVREVVEQSAPAGSASAKAAQRTKKARRELAAAEKDAASIPKKRAAAARKVTKAAEDKTREKLAKAADDLAAKQAESAKAMQVPDPILKPRGQGDWWKNFDRVQTWKAQGAGVAPAGYRGLKHEAAELLRHLDPDQTPASKKYVLVSGSGEKNVRGQIVKAGLTLDEALAELLKRQTNGDEIWFSDHRNVANWRQKAKKNKPAGQLVAQYHFATAEEGEVVAKWQKKPLAQLPENKLGFGLGADWDAMAAKFWGKAPKAQRPELTEMQTAFADAIEDAMLARVRSQSGLDLVPLAGGIYVTRPERRAITTRVNDLYSSTGFNVKKVKIGEDGTLTYPDEAAAKRYFGRSGIAVPTTRDELNRAQALVIRHIAGRSVDAKYAMRGTGRLTESMARVIMSSPDVLMRGGASLWTRLTVPHAAVKSLPPQTRRIVESALRELESVGSQVLNDITDLRRKGATSADVLNMTVKNYRPIPDRELALIDAVDTGEAIVDRLSIYATRDAIANELKAGAEIPELWDSNDYVRIKEGIQNYVRTRKEQLAVHGQMVVKAMLPDDMAGRVGSIEGFDDAWYREAYLRFIRDGEDDLGFRSMVMRIAGPEGAGKLNTGDRMLRRYAVLHKADEVAERVAQKLLEAEVGSASPTITKIITRMIAGQPTGEFLNTDVAIAEAFLRRWGMNRDMRDVPIKEFGKASLPKGLVDELEKAAQRGSRIRRQGLESGAMGYMYRLYKDALTTFNQAFILGTWAGLLPTALSEVGVEGVAGAVTQITRHPLMTYEMVRRLTERPFHRLPPRETRVFYTDAGLVFSADDIERGLRQEAAAEALNKVLTAQDLEREMQMVEGKWDLLGLWRVNNMPLGDKVAAVRIALGEARNAISQAAEVSERAFRIGVFLDVLKKTGSMEAAGEAGRSALFNYSELTNFDRKLARWGLVFWAFQRKSLDSFFTQLANNPQRVGAQFRFARDQRKMHGDEDPLVRLQGRDSDQQRLVLGRLESDDGGTYEFTTTGVLNQVDGFSTALDLIQVALGPLDMVFGKGKAFKESAQELVGGANPVLTFAGQTILNVDPGTGIRTTAERSNLIYPSMMQPPFRTFTETLFGPIAEVSLPPDQAHRAVGFHPNGEAYAYGPHPDRLNFWLAYDGAVGRLSGSVDSGFMALGAVLKGAGIEDNFMGYATRRDPRADVSQQFGGFNLLDILPGAGVRVREVRGPVGQRVEMMSEQAREMRQEMPKP